MIQRIGAAELEALTWPLKVDTSSVPAILFSDDAMKKYAHTHILFFTPQKYVDSSPITLNSLRSAFGTDQAASEPCFYNQDWYLKEAFASQPLDGAWHLIRKDVLEDARARLPEDIERTLPGEAFPTAVTCAFAFFAWWFHTGGQRLWEHDFVWCSDRDHNGDRVYVGRYEDPDGVNKNGLNVHRFLSLRKSYSAAPEIVK